MGVIVKRAQPCPSCSSSDALQVYEDGGAKCFSCGKFFKKYNGEEPPKVSKSESFAPVAKGPTIEEIQEYAMLGFEDRDITGLIARHYKVRTSFSYSGQPEAHYYPYNGETMYKVRRLPKEFHTVGKGKLRLFGIELFSAGGKRVVICEGEIDTLTVAQASYDKYNKFYPVVGIPSSNITEGLIHYRDWLRSFEEIVLAFDNDEAGKAAEVDALRILGYDKCKVVNLGTLNDMNQLHMQSGPKAVMSAIFDAHRVVPTGILSTEDLRLAMKRRSEQVAIPYPECMAGVNSKVRGMRDGEIVMFTSGTGSGKSTIVREIIYDLATVKKIKCGAIMLEESPGDTALKMSGLHMCLNVSKHKLTEEQEDEGFNAVFGEDLVMVYDHQGAITDGSVIDRMEYMCLMGCRVIVVDHITILVSEGFDGDTGNEAEDKLMNAFLKIAKKYPVTIILVAHLRKTPNDKKSFEEGRMPSLDDLKGSGSIKQIPFDIIASCRNLKAEDPFERNHIRVCVLKGRTGGETGDVEGMNYDSETGRLSRRSAEGFKAVPTTTIEDVGFREVPPAGSYS